MKKEGEKIRFIVYERYNKQIDKLKKDGKATDQEFLARICPIGKKQFQNYIYGKCHIPADSLTNLCRYLNVSEKWLTGETDLYSGFGTFLEDYAQGVFRTQQIRLLIEYLYISGMTKERSGIVKGVRLTPHELELLYRQIMVAIDHSVDSCIDSILSCRKIYDVEIHQ